MRGRVLLRSRLAAWLAIVGVAAAVFYCAWHSASTESSAPVRYSAPSPENTRKMDSYEVQSGVETAQQTVVEYLLEQSAHVGRRSDTARSDAAVAAAGPYRAFAGAATEALPPVRASSQMPLARAFEAVDRKRGAALVDDLTGPGGTITAARLSEIAQYSGGVTGRIGASWLLRAAPSAGALYPIDLYVAIRDVPPAAAGLYYYHPAERGLVRLGGLAQAQEAATYVADPEAIRRAPVWFVLGATFTRTTVRYRERSYRYIALDAGHLAANLMLAASANGQRCRIEPRFEDRMLARAVGYQTLDEGILLVVRCGEPQVDTARSSAEGSAADRPALAELPASADTLDLTQLFHQLTSSPVPADPLRSVRDDAPPKAADGDVALTAPGAAPGDVYEVIGARRSFRDFSLRSVSESDLAGVLRDSVGVAPTVRPFSLIYPFVIVRAVEGVSPGVYRYLAETNALRRLRVGDAQRELRHAGHSQRALARAAFVVGWAVRVSEVSQTHGAAGLRYALLDAGIAGEHAYLSATARGLGACGVGAFRDDEMNELVSGETRGLWVVYLVAIGQRN